MRTGLQRVAYRWMVRLLGALVLWPVVALADVDVLVVHNRFVSAEKFQQWQALAQHEGVRLTHLDVEGAAPAALADAVGAADLVLLDVPRPNDRAAVQARLAELPAAAARVPRVTVGGGPPDAAGIDAAIARPLAAHYAAGGEVGFRRVFQLARAWHAQVAPPADSLKPAERLPSTGFYHPDAPRIFDRLPDYLAWSDARAQGRRGRVAVLVHAGVVSDGLTRPVDMLVRRLEAADLQPIVFWFDASETGGIAGALAQGGVDALVNMTHLQNGAARTADFQALDIPVLQTLRFREGDAADWSSAASGIGARTTAVFLAGPEAWGVTDPVVLSAATAGVEDLLPRQADALVAKLQRLVALRHTPPADKRLALLFWNYPAGEKNLGASHLNIPRSVVALQAALAGAGYDVGPAIGEADVIAAGQRMLGGVYGTVPLDDLLTDGLAGTYPVAAYERWLASLPPARQAELRHGGRPDAHPFVREIDGERVFVIPRWQLGHWVVMPQMPREAQGHGHYHDTDAAPDHAYFAAYLYLRQTHAADALIHLGTHGTQEWLPGKDRGLAASDYPWLAVGDLPVFYPYIQDNVGEALQARRRGRAVTVSHQTPPFAPAGLYDELRDVHHAIHEYQLTDEGGVREQAAARLFALADAAGMWADLGWRVDDARARPAEAVQVLHDHLHELARTAMPLGLHTLGQPAAPAHRAATVMQQLGDDFIQALGADEEALVVDATDDLSRHPGVLAVQRLLEHPSAQGDREGDAGMAVAVNGAAGPAGINGAPDAAPLPPGILAFTERARALAQRRLDTQEMESLLAGLAGRLVPPGAGGDPIRNPDVASGRNLYAFEPDKIPARAAYDAGAIAYEQLVQAFRSEHDGDWPDKLAFSLWSSETIRHLGVTEAQILQALGLRPVWDAGGRLTDLAIIPRAELGRPRTDVVVQVTGVYRDQFDGFLRLLDTAMAELAVLDEPDNPIAANTARLAEAFAAKGMSADAARAAAGYRIFGQAPGAYGTGVPDLALRSTDWEDNAVLGEQFLQRSRHAYGREAWGVADAGVNVFAEQLRGTQAAVLARSSNLHGVLSTDHPFEFLGGLSAAVQVVDGKAPQLLVSDLRRPDVRTTGLSRFLADEMRARYLNPQWIAGMQAEGYAGTLEVLAATNNLFGWQAMDATTVRDDQWQALFDTYVADTRGLGTSAWFEAHHPTAQAQMLERMAEAMRKGYWKASDDTREALAQRWQTLEREHGVDTGAALTRQFIADMAQGYGLTATPAPLTPVSSAAPDVVAPDTSADPASAAPPETPPSTPAAQETVQGQVLEAVAAEAVAEDASTAFLLAVMILLMLAGGLHQAHAARRRPFPVLPS